MTPKIFVSYNPGVTMEQSTALRLQTLSSLYGVEVSLPDRLATKELKATTKDRILNAHVFVMFCTRKLSKAVKEETEFALHNNKRVVIFYDRATGKIIKTHNIKPGNLIEIPFNPNQDTLASLLTKVLDKGGFVHSEDMTLSGKREAESENNLLTSIVGIGLGLLLVEKMLIKNNYLI
jgi:hypothetical protein